MKRVQNIIFGWNAATRTNDSWVFRCGHPMSIFSAIPAGDVDKETLRWRPLSTSRMGVQVVKGLQGTRWCQISQIIGLCQTLCRSFRTGMEPSWTESEQCGSARIVGEFFRPLNRWCRMPMCVRWCVLISVWTMNLAVATRVFATNPARRLGF